MVMQHAIQSKFNASVVTVLLCNIRQIYIPYTCKLSYAHNLHLNIYVDHHWCQFIGVAHIMSPFTMADLPTCGPTNFTPNDER